MELVVRKLLVLFALCLIGAAPSQAWEDVSDFFTCDFFCDMPSAPVVSLPRGCFKEGGPPAVGDDKIPTIAVPYLCTGGLADFGPAFEVDPADLPVVTVPEENEENTEAIIPSWYSFFVTWVDEIIQRRAQRYPDIGGIAAGG